MKKTFLLTPIIAMMIIFAGCNEQDIIDRTQTTVDTIGEQVHNPESEFQKTVYAVGNIADHGRDVVEAIPYIPYKGEILFGLAVVSGVLNIFQRLTVKKTEKAIAEVVKGAEKFKESADLNTILAFKNCQKSAQSPETQKIVAARRADL